MKFTDGYWLLRPGVQALYPAQAYRAITDSHSLSVIAPVSPVTERRHTVDLPALTVECTAAMPDVIRVRLSHFLGGRVQHPVFPVTTNQHAPADVGRDDGAAWLTSGSLTARFSLGDNWLLEFLADGRRLTSSGRKAMAAIGTADGGSYIREQLDLSVGEHVYGLGERFGPLVKNGQVVDTWNADAGTTSDQAYKCVPFYVTDRGYGVFVNHTGNVSFEVASEVVSRVQFSVPGQVMEYFVIYGPSPREIMRKYTALTGRPALPPAWSFGLWLSTSFSTDYDESSVAALLDEMARRDLPLSVFHFDAFWMREFHWCDFQWNPDTFPDPKDMLRRLADRGLRVSVWISPYIAQQSSLFAEAAAAGYLLRTAQGDVWQWDLWQAGTAVVDFTNPAARQWYADKLETLLALGVDCFKADFGERIPTDVVYFDNGAPDRMHNFYAYLYNETVFEVLRRHRGDGDAVVFARAATAGTQRFPVHWGGDCESTLTAMAESLRGGLSLAMSGFAFWSHDIGGFAGTPDPAVFKRWIPFGLLSSHSRLHGSATYRVPWLFDEEAVSVLRTYTRLKAWLMPYLYQLAVTAHREGTPVMRPMVFEFPDDPGCAYLDQQYMLGDSILVAPVFTADGEITWYVPAGRWTDLRTGEVFTGPGWSRRRYDFHDLPVLVRPGSVIPVGAQDDRPDYAYVQDITLRVYEPTSGQVTVEVPTLSGEVAATFTVVCDGTRLNVERTATVDPHGRWSVLLVGFHDIVTTGDESVRTVAEGVLVEPHSSHVGCSIILPATPGVSSIRDGGQ